jgi:hypothetical protein
MSHAPPNFFFAKKKISEAWLLFGISTQARTGIIYLEGRGTNHCTILTVILLYLVITRDSRVKGIEPLLTILEIVALTVILHSFPHLFTFLLFL